MLILVKLQESFVKENAIELLWKFVERFHGTNSKIALSCIGGIASLIDESGAMETYSNPLIFKFIIGCQKMLWNYFFPKILKSLTHYSPVLLSYAPLRHRKGF